MLTAVENITEAYLRDVEPCITLMASRPAQAYVRLVEPVAMPEGPTIRTFLAKDPSGTKAVETGQGLSVSPSAADIAVAQILRLEKYEADWDGSEAAKPLAYSLKEAHAFIRRLSPDSIIPRPALHADGHTILFVREADVYAELEFLGNSKIGFYARRGEQKWSDEISFDGQSLPEGLSQIGFSL
jgi:hypothetical protein